MNMTSAVVGLPHGNVDPWGTYTYRCGTSFCGISPKKYDYWSCASSQVPLDYCIDTSGLSSDNPPNMSPAGEVSMSLASITKYLQWVTKAQQGYDVPVVSKETIQYMLSNATGYPMPGGYTYTHGFIVDYSPCVQIFGENCIYYLGSEGAIWTQQFYIAPTLDRIFVVSTNGALNVGDLAANDALEAVVQTYPGLLGK